MPHPTEELVNIRVQTTGELTAAQAMRNACQDLTSCLAHMKTVFVERCEDAGI